jgi:hypothetical protein
MFDTYLINYVNRHYDIFTVTSKGVLLPDKSVNPTISLKYIVTQSNHSGVTNFPRRSSFATDL